MVGRERLGVVGKVLFKEPGLRKTEGMEMRMTELSGNRIFKRFSSRKNLEKGFTLVELIVVLVIIAIIAAVAIPAMLGFTDDAKEKAYVTDAEEAYNAAQAVLTQLYNDSSNQLDHKKRLKISELAGADSDNTVFNVWTAKKLEDGITLSTSENIGSYTILYALYETTNDGTGKYVFYNGKDWTVYDSFNDVKGVLTSYQISSETGNEKGNIIHLWPDYEKSDDFKDTAYNPITPDPEVWDDGNGEDNNDSFVLKVHNFNNIQGRTEPGVIFKLGELESGTPDTLNVEFEKDNANGIISKNWTAEDKIEIKGNVYTIKCLDGFYNLRWCTKADVSKASDSDFLTYQQIIDNIVTLNSDGISDIYAVTDKEVEEKKAIFKCVEGSTSLTFGSNGSSSVEVSIKRYTNKYDRDNYGKNKSINSGEGTLSGLSNLVKVSKYCKLDGWAFEDNGAYETDPDSGIIKSYNVQKEEIWNKVFATEYDQNSVDTFIFVGITKKIKSVKLLADEKGLLTFNGASSMSFEASINELTGEESDDFDRYNSQSLITGDGVVIKGWEKYRSNPVQSFGTIEEVWQDVHNGNEGNYTYIAKVGYGSRAKFITRKTDNDYLDQTNMAGQIRFLFNGLKRNNDKNLYFQKQSYSAAVEVLTGAGLINQIMTGYDNSNIADDYAVQCSGHCKCIEANKTVSDGTIKKLAIMWDGNDQTYDIPIFAYTVVNGNDYHVYWFSRENHPELVGKFHGIFDNYYKISFAGSCIEDWNTSGCTHMYGMFQGSGLVAGEIDFTKWDYSSVVDMHQMFYGCTKLTNISFENCSMPNCTSFNSIFSNCTALTTINLNRLYTPSLTNIKGLENKGSMLSGDTVLTTFWARGWNAPSITSMANMFDGRTSLQTADFSNYDVDNVTNLSGVTTMNQMFLGCSSLRSLSFEGLELNSCTTFNELCKNCTSLTTANFNKCKTPKLTVITSMFNNVPKMTTFTAKGWVVGNPISFKDFMSGKSNLVTFEIKDFDEENKTDLTGCTSMQNMFYNCTSLQYMALDEMDLRSCTSFYQMFYGCTNLISVNLDKCNTPSLTSVGSMFSNATSLTAFSARGWKAGKLKSLEKFMDGRTNLASFNILSFDDENGKTDLSACTNINNLLYNCKALKSVSFKELDLSSCTTASYMMANCDELETVIFDDCNMSSLREFKSNVFTNDYKLKTFSAKNWDVRSVTSFQELFYRGVNQNQLLPDNLYGDYGKSGIESVDFSGAKLHSVTSMRMMFDNCPVLLSVSFEGAEINTESTVDTYWLFFHSFRLYYVNLNFAEGWTLHPNNMYKFFDYCLNLHTVDFGGENVTDNLDTSYATDVSNIFYNNWNLDPDYKFYEEFKFDSAKRAYRTFYGIFNENMENNTNSGVEITFENKNMSQITETQQMFYGAAIRKVTFKNCDLGSLTNIANMFTYSMVEEIEFINCNMSSLTGLGSLFASDYLQTVRLNHTDMSKVAKLESVGLFTGKENHHQVAADNKTIISTNLKTFEAKGWNISGATSFYQMFKNMTALESFDVSEYEYSGTDGLSKVPTMFNSEANISMREMFMGCTNLTSVKFSDNTDLSKVTSFMNMFSNCSSLTPGSFRTMFSEWDLSGSTITYKAYNNVQANTIISNGMLFTTEETYTSKDGRKFKLGGDISKPANCCLKEVSD